MAAIGHWNKEGQMDEELLYWDNAKFMKMIVSRLDEPRAPPGGTMMRPTNRTLLVSVALSAAAGSLATAEGAASPADPRLPEPGTYSLDPPHTFVEFRAQHKVVGTVRGRFDKAAGSIVVSKDPADCSLEVSIDASSLSTQNAVRDADVKGPDFFDAAKFPAITYKGKGIRRTARGWVIDGTLTIRDVSGIVPLEFHFNGVAPAQPGKPERVGFQATAAVQRASFGMKRELLDEIGKESKAPDVWIEIDAEALRDPAAKP